MATAMNQADTPDFYVWLESVAQGSDRAAIHARDAMATGLRLQVIEESHVSLNPVVDKVTRRYRKQNRVAGRVARTSR